MHIHLARKDQIVYIVFGLLLGTLLFMLGWAVLVRAHENSDGNFQNQNQTEQGDNNGEVEDMMAGNGQFQFNDFPKGLENRFEDSKPALNVTPQGRILVTSAEVTQANWPNLTVKVWGLSLNIQVNSDAVIHGIAVNTTASSTPSTPQVSAGDHVDFLGTIDKDTGLIHATHFKDRTASSAKIQDLQTKIQQLQEQLRKLIEQLQAEAHNQ